MVMRSAATRQRCSRRLPVAATWQTELEPKPASGRVLTRLRRWSTGKFRARPHPRWPNCGQCSRYSDRHGDVALVACTRAPARHHERSRPADCPEGGEMNPLPISESELHAYIDGLLPESRCAEIERYLSTHPEEASVCGSIANR